MRAHLRLAPQVNRDAFTLIDVLSVSALAGFGERASAIYEKLGDTAAAERLRAESAPLMAPVKQYKERNNQVRASFNHRDFKLRGGIMAGMLLPALGEGELPTPEQLEPGRMLEYVVADGMALVILSVVLFAVMLLAALGAIYYRWIRPGRTASVLLLPESGELARLLAVSVFLPLLGYYLVTRWWPWSAREVNVGFWMPAFAMQGFAVLFAMIGLALALAKRSVRRRCAQLQLPVPSPSHRFWAVAGWGWWLCWWFRDFGRDWGG